MNQSWEKNNQIFLRYKYIYIYNEIVNCYSQFHVRVENLQTVDPRREIRCNNNFILLYMLHSLIVYIYTVIAIYIYKYIYIYIYIYIYMCTVIADIFLIGKFISSIFYDVIKLHLHTAMNRADFVSWWMWFNG